MVGFEVLCMISDICPFHKEAASFKPLKVGLLHKLSATDSFSLIRLVSFILRLTVHVAQREFDERENWVTECTSSTAKDSS